MIKTAASLIIILLIGYAAFLLMFRAMPIRNRTLGFVFALGLGFGLIAELGMVSLLLAGSLDFRLVYVVAVLGSVAILYKKKSGGFSSLFALASLRGIPRDNGYSERPTTQRIIKSLGRIAVAVVALVVAVNLLARPMYQIDARVIWGLKAKILFQEHTIFSESVEDISRNHPHPRYPLLIPVASAWIFNNIGEVDDRAVRMLFLIFFAGLVAVTYQLAREQSGNAAGRLSISAMVFAPFVYGSMSGGASSGHADIALSFYIAASTMAMMMWMKEKDVTFAVGAALFAAFAALTKNEGIIFALNLLFATAAFSLSKGKEDPGYSERALSAEWFKARKPRFLGFATYALVFAIALAPWLFVRAGLPRFLDEDYTRHLNVRDISAGLARLPIIAQYFGAEALNVRNWGLVWILAIPSACMAWRNGNRESRFISVVISLQAASYVAVFVITPDDLAWQMSVSLSRLFLHVLPLAAVLVSIQAVDGVRIMDKDQKP